MSNISTAIRFDHTAKENARVLDWSSDFQDRDNADFFAAVAKELARIGKKSGAKGATVDASGAGAIVLVGEYGFPGYGIRTAQNVLRIDRTPSNWSHVLFLQEGLPADAAAIRDPERSPLVLESTLSQGVGLNHFAFKNGVSVGRLSTFARTEYDASAESVVPNVAVLYFALTAEERSAVLERALNPDADQLGYDLCGQLGAWFSYGTSRGAKPNPLAEGVGLASASLVQLAYDAAGIGLAPGAHQRNIAPEHIWQAVKFLHETFFVMEGGKHVPRLVGGFYCVRDRACVQYPVDAKVPRSLSELVASSRGGGRTDGGSGRSSLRGKKR
ncbi:MAG TPA: hypothetical protein VHE30_01330 [Polyangiaceae bacterium]|nr:hypothetical protein [Polyangiaceae bacterium]